MSRMTPPNRPQQSAEKSRAILALHGVDTSKAAILCMRGYFRDSMGKVGVNDRGIYDDAIFVVTPTEHKSFWANTDPTRYKHGVAMIKPGVYPYKFGYHKYGQPTGHPALRPATPGEALPVWRDGIENPRPGIACNIHRGGRTTTSSEGCITVHPDHWDVFYVMARRVAQDFGQVQNIPVCLIEQQG